MTVSSHKCSYTALHYNHPVSADVIDECSPRNITSCPENSTCLAAGVAGRYTCVNRMSLSAATYTQYLSSFHLDLREGEICNTNFDVSVLSARLPISIQARESLNSDVNDFMVPCQRGLVCRRESLVRSVCTAESTNQGLELSVHC